MQVHRRSILGLIGARNGCVHRDDVCWRQSVVKGELNRNTSLRNDDSAQVLLRLRSSAERKGWVVTPQSGGTECGMDLVSKLTDVDCVMCLARYRCRKRIRRCHRNAAGPYSPKSGSP